MTTEKPLSTKSPLRYPGGKTRAVKTLLPLFPEDAKVIGSPFFGGGSIELALTGIGKTIVAADVFGFLVDFWQEMLSNPKKLADEIEPYLGTVTRDKFLDMQKTGVPEDRTESAVKFFILNRCSFSGAGLSGGYSSSSAVDRFTKSAVDRVRDFHNPNVTVKHDDFEHFILNEKYDCLFLDPPYFIPSKLYGKNGDLQRGFDHYRLREILEDITVPVVMTYNNGEEIRDMYGDWNQTETLWAYGMNKSKQSSELILTNF